MISNADDACSMCRLFAFFSCRLRLSVALVACACDLLVDTLVIRERERGDEGARGEMRENTNHQPNKQRPNNEH